MKLYLDLVASCDAYCVVVAVLCICVEDGALGGLMSLCVCAQTYRRLSILTPNVNVGMVAVRSSQGLCLSFVPDFYHCLLINSVKEGVMGTWSRL